MIEDLLPHKPYRMLAERICLDFTNTTAALTTDHPAEYLDNYADLVVWSMRAGILAQAEAMALIKEAGEHPREAEVVFARALKLRETIWRIFAAIAAGLRPDDGDVAALNAQLTTFPVRLYLANSGEKYVCDWLADKTKLDGLLNPIAWSAATLLASDEVSWVKECPGDNCGWLFLDLTKNHSRRWCDMADCGSRAKAKRYYRRQHSS